METDEILTEYVLLIRDKARRRALEEWGDVHLSTERITEVEQRELRAARQEINNSMNVQQQVKQMPSQRMMSNFVSNSEAAQKAAIEQQLAQRPMSNLEIARAAALKKAGYR